MQSKLFHGLIATLVSITVSIPDITLAGNRQPQTWTLSELELSCISNKLQERAEYDERAKLVESNIHNNFTILEKLAVLDEYGYRIAYICLNDNNRQIFTDRQKDTQQAEEAFQNNNDIEPPRRIDNYAFFSEWKNIPSEVLKAMQESFTTPKTTSPPRVPSKTGSFFRLRRIK